MLILESSLPHILRQTTGGIPKKEEKVGFLKGLKYQSERERGVYKYTHYKI
jgi:hypothetical protein